MNIQPTIDEARRQQTRYRYRSYQGPKLTGRRSVISFGTEAYPQALAMIPNPPEKLYVIGDTDALVEGLAVIGARKATPYGIACARRFAGYAASRDICIISGGAYGCDSAAHRSALEAGGRTVAFLGGGCDEIYPAKHHGLFQEIIDAGGAVVSEYEWGFPALPFTFRLRNRLIAGLARATLIVEAGLPSGTFSTADEALAASRDVLVVPGSIGSATSAGSNRLLYQGAIPIVDDETFDDVLCGLFGFLHEQTVQDASGVDGKAQADISDGMLEALRANPMRIDELASLTFADKGAAYDDAAWLNVHLAELQRDGLVERFPDGRYGPCSV